MFFQVIYSIDSHSAPKISVVKGDTLEQAMDNFAEQFPNSTLIHIDGVDREQILDVSDPEDYQKLVDQIKTEILDPDEQEKALSTLSELAAKFSE